MFLIEIFKKIKFCVTADRIGPDLPFTHWKLYFPSSMVKLCKKKFLQFGDGAELRPGAYAIHCSQISIGKNVIIRPNTVIMADSIAKVILRDNVLIGMGVHFYVNNHKFEKRSISILDQGYYPSKCIIINEGAWIGANAIILPGIVVGKNSVVGAGSIVTKDVPDYTIVAGNPAKVIRQII